MLVYVFSKVKSENVRLRQLLEKLRLILTRSIIVPDSQIVSTAATLLAVLPRKKSKSRKPVDTRQLRLALREVA